MSNSNKDVEIIKDTVNIVDVIGKVVELKKMGANHKGLCPFHTEKTPSFTVTENKQMYKCFGCSEGGDVLHFVQKYYNLTFKEAIEMLANDYGIKLEKKFEKDRTPYYQANNLAAKFYHLTLTRKNNKALSYMQRRGINIKTLKKFGIGYARDSWNDINEYMISQGISSDIVTELGLVVKKNNAQSYDTFRDRVIFPIFNPTGKVIGFGGRAIGNTMPKYLNSAESVVFNKRYNLYALNFAKQEIGKTGVAILVEGYMDVVSLWNSGVKNSVATLGTAFTPEQAKLLSRYAKDIVIAYDSDEAGQKATLKAIDELQREKCIAKVIIIQGAKDPDEYIKKYGKSSFDELVSSAITAVDFKLNYAKKNLDMNIDQDKISYMAKVGDILVKLSPVEQEIYISKTATYMGMPESVIKRELETKGANTSDIVSIGARADRKSSEEQNIGEYRADAEYQDYIASQYDEIYQNYEFDEIYTDVQEQFFPHSKDGLNSRDTESISSLEKYLIKLFYINKEYLYESDKHDGILVNNYAIKIREFFRSEYETKEVLDKNKIIAALDEKESIFFTRILDDIIINGEDEKIFNDCIVAFEEKCLKNREKCLNESMKNAKRDGDIEKTKLIMRELYNLQKQMRGL